MDEVLGVDAAPEARCIYAPRTREISGLAQQLWRVTFGGERKPISYRSSGFHAGDFCAHGRVSMSIMLLRSADADLGRSLCNAWMGLAICSGRP